MNSTERTRAFRERRKAQGLPGVDPMYAKSYYEKNKESISEKRKAKRREERPGGTVGRPRLYHTPEERREARNKQQRKYDQKKAPNRPIYAGRPVYSKEERRYQKNVNRKDKPAAPVRVTPRATNSKSRPIKPERAMVIPKDNPAAVLVRLNARTEVMALPGYDISQLRAKFGIK